MNAIEVQGLTKVYSAWWGRKKVYALNDLALQVGTNTVYGFLGPNGAGKTTTIKLMLGLLSPSAGSGTLLGEPLGNRTVKERIGFLPDSPNFYPHLTAKDFLVYCSRLLHLPWSVYAPRIDQLLERMSLTEARNRRLSQFSRGMLQRVGIAQALLNDPDLVILDEPITGLDPLGRVEVKLIIEELKKQGKTVFFSSHILADVEQMCDVIAILNKGRLVCHGNVNTLLAEREVTVWVDQITPDAIAALEAVADTVIKKKGQWGFGVSGTQNARTLQQQVRQLGANIAAVEGKRESLEEFFLARVENDNQAQRSSQ